MLCDLFLAFFDTAHPLLKACLLALFISFNVPSLPLPLAFRLFSLPQTWLLHPMTTSDQHLLTLQIHFKFI